MFSLTAGILLPAALPAVSAAPVADTILPQMPGGDGTVPKKYGFSVIPCTCFLTEMTRKKQSFRLCLSLRRPAAMAVWTSYIPWMISGVIPLAFLRKTSVWTLPMTISQLMNCWSIGASMPSLISTGAQNLQKMHRLTLLSTNKGILYAGLGIKCAPRETIRSNRLINIAARWNAAGSLPVPMKRNAPKAAMAGQFTLSTIPISVFIPCVPRDSVLYKETYSKRTASERVNDRVLNDYCLQHLKIRGKDHFSFWTMLIGICIHLDTRYKTGCLN